MPFRFKLHVTLNGVASTFDEFASSADAEKYLDDNYPPQRGLSWSIVNPAGRVLFAHEG